MSVCATHCNNVRLSSAVGQSTPADMLAGWQQEIHTERDRKMEPLWKQPRIRASRPLDIR
jgi:hypothetical protein